MWKNAAPVSTIDISLVHSDSYFHDRVTLSHMWVLEGNPKIWKQKLRHLIIIYSFTHSCWECSRIIFHRVFKYVVFSFVNYYSPTISLTNLQTSLPTILSENSRQTSYPNSSSSAVSMTMSSSMLSIASVCISS